MPSITFPVQGSPQTTKGMPSCAFALPKQMSRTDAFCVSAKVLAHFYAGREAR
jgi:hypothetical protein